MSRGFVESTSAALAIALLAGFAVNQFFSQPALVADSLAQIGATLLVAYALQMAWVLENSPTRRGKERENWVGWTMGVGFCASWGEYSDE